MGDNVVEHEQPRGTTFAPAAPTTQRLPAHPPAILLLMVLCLGAFAGTTTLVIISGSDVVARVRYVIFAATALFVTAMIVGLVWRTRRMTMIAAVLAALACAGGLYAAVEANRQYGVLKERFLAGRPGPVVTRLPMYQGQQLGRNMLTSIAASVATITGVPLVLYLAVRASREGDELIPSPATPGEG
jgi:hypothetical protein